MGIPTNENWEINANGAHGALNITSIDAQGRLQGMVFGQKLVGWWDDEDQRMAFLRIGDPNDPASCQSFIGYAWTKGSPGVTTFFLAGSFDTYAGGGGSAKRPSYGWFASVQVSVA